MLIDLFPRTHVRFTRLTRLGAHLGGLARWLHLRGFAAEVIRKRIRKAPALEALLPALGEGGLCELSQERLLELAPRPARENLYLSAHVRSLAIYLDELGLLRQTVATPGERVVDTYLDFLGQVRGLAACTISYHGHTVRELLTFPSEYAHAAGAVLTDAGFASMKPQLSDFLPVHVRHFLDAPGRVAQHPPAVHLPVHVRPFPDDPVRVALQPPAVLLPVLVRPFPGAPAKVVPCRVAHNPPAVPLVLLVRPFRDGPVRVAHHPIPLPLPVRVRPFPDVPVRVALHPPALLLPVRVRPFIDEPARVAHNPPAVPLVLLVRPFRDGPVRVAHHPIPLPLPVRVRPFPDVPARVALHPPALLLPVRVRPFTDVPVRVAHHPIPLPLPVSEETRFLILSAVPFPGERTRTLRQAALACAGPLCRGALA